MSTDAPNPMPARVIGDGTFMAPPGRISPANRRAAARALVRYADRHGTPIAPHVREIAAWSDAEVAGLEQAREAEARRRRD